MAIANFSKVAACSVRYFLPGTIWFPVTTRYASHPIRLRTAAESVPGKSTKVNLRGGRGNPRAADSRRALILAQELAGFLVDEMKPGAGQTDHRRIEIGIGLVLRRGRRKPVLHVDAQPRALEKNMPAHHRKYAKLDRPVTSVCLRSLRVFWRRMRSAARRRGRGRKCIWARGREAL